MNKDLWPRLLPFLAWWRHLTPETLRCDLFAGVTNAVIVLPQGVAYAMLAGLPPEYGLYAAIVPAIIAALFGSSWHLISGPTAALSIVVYTTLSPLATPGSPAFISLALTLTLMAGLFQLGLALARMGVLVNFVSHSVVIGFTAGAAVVIATGQIPNLLGVPLPSDGTFIGNWQALPQSIAATNPHALAIALLTLVTCVLMKRFLPRWPGMLVAMLVGSGAAYLLDAPARGVAMVGSIPAALPPFQVPELSFSAIHNLASGALAIALLGLVEAVSIARSVATRSRQLISGNQEFMGQALSNIGGAFFSCYASSGSFTRTGVNYASGARTPLAAIFAALILALIVLLLSNLTAFVPIPAMAAILMVVAWSLIDFAPMRTIVRAGHSEAAVLLITFIATLVMAMEFAIYVGVMLSLVFYLKRTSSPRIVEILPAPGAEHPVFAPAAERDLPRCPQLRIIRIEGSLFFGAVNYVQEYLQSLPDTRILIVGSAINFIDIAGAEMLRQEAERRQAAGGALYLSNLKLRALRVLERSGYLDALGAGTIFPNKGVAIAEIYKQLVPAICASCPAQIFSECKVQLPDGTLRTRPAPTDSEAEPSV